MSEAEDHIIPETQESNENDAVEASVDENLLNTSIGDDYPANDSQDFSLVDFGASQSTQLDCDVNKSTEMASSEATLSEIVDKPVPDVEAVQDAKNLEPAETQTDEKATIEPENKSDVEPTDPVQDADDEVIAPTPPDELVPPKRQLLGSVTALKRKADDSEELISKMLRPADDSVKVATEQTAEKHAEDKQTQELPLQTSTEAEIMENSEPEMKEKVVELPEELDTTLSQSAMDTEPAPCSPAAKENTEEAMSVIDSIAEPEKSLAAPEQKIESKSESEKAHVKSRQSIEVIYEKPLTSAKPKELVEIDEEGEKIVLDASHEDTARQEANLERKLTNGSDELKKTPTSDKTASMSPNTSSSGSEAKTPQPQKRVPLLNLVSDSEGESSISEEKKNKIVTVEREMTILLKVKCLVSVDEVTRDIINGEFTVVQCESPNNSPRERKDSDASAMADISDSSKDPTSPASVTSNPAQTFPLSARLSLMSQASSSSSSSADSIKAKGSNEFSLPRGVPKHAKKTLEHAEDSADRLRKDFKNVGLVTSNVLKFIHDELHAGDFHNGIDSSLEPFNASTPETGPVATPKSTKRGRVTKRTRNANSRTSKTNGMAKTSPAAVATVVEEKPKASSPSNCDIPSTPTRQGSRASVKQNTPSQDTNEPLVGRKCFARWTDKNYYPAVISGRTRSKLKVNFLDGKSKLLIEEFVVPSPDTLPLGLSVYAATEGDEYGSCGVILSVAEEANKTLYTIETDEDEKIAVPIAEIFLTEDQVKILREDAKDMKTPPPTPTSSLVSLDNLVDGSRRKQSPIVSTPKSTSSRRTPMKKSLVDSVASSSGLPKKITDHLLDTSDSNVSAPEDSELGAVHAEVPGVSSEFVPKGPQSRIKGKARSKKKPDDPETISMVGPMPEEGSQLFQGLNFILTCGQLESLDKYKAEYKPDSNSEVGTEYEEEWTSRPFIRERLVAQITAGGGKVYENFDEVPTDEYKNTRLITNVPNATERSLLCLSVGIKAYNHNWVVRCCKEKKLLDKGEEVLPAGWSLDKRSYVEFHQRKSNKPFNHVVVVIPKIPSAEKSMSLWQKIIENAGGIVKIVSDPVKDEFPHATVVLTNKKCPSWVEKQAQNWTIPLVSTTWIVQCLIEGDTVPHDTQSAYVHTYTMN